MSKFNCMECWHVMNPYNHVDEVYDEVMLICCIVYNEFIEKFINLLYNLLTIFTTIVVKLYKYTHSYIILFHAKMAYTSMSYPRILF